MLDLCFLLESVFPAKFYQLLRLITSSTQSIALTRNTCIIVINPHLPSGPIFLINWMRGCLMYFFIFILRIDIPVSKQ